MGVDMYLNPVIRELLRPIEHIISPVVAKKCNLTCVCVCVCVSVCLSVLLVCLLGHPWVRGGDGESAAEGPSHSAVGKEWKGE